MNCFLSRSGNAFFRLVAPAAAAFGLLATQPIHAAPRVQVRGASRVEMQAFGPTSRMTIMGTLRDEVGAPIPRAKILMGAFVAQDVPAPWLSIFPCGRLPSATFVEHVDDAIEVDDAGTWCVIATLGRDRAALRATFGGDVLHDGPRSEILWDAAQRAMSLSFSPRPDRIDLDAPRNRVSCRVTVPADVGSAGIQLELRDERGQSLGSVYADDAGLAVFDIATAKLSGPGIGALHLGFAGNSSLAATSTTTSITRFARVKLEPGRDELQGDPSSGLDVHVRASTARGPVSEGTVEAVFGSDVVGTGVVRAGVADMFVTFSPPRGVATVGLAIRYVADAPYHMPGESARVTVRLVQSAVALRFLPVVVAAGVAVWLLRGWRRPRRLERVDALAKEPKGVASLEIVGETRTVLRWSGRVVDAHDSEPVPGARLRVIAPSFVDLDVVRETLTGSDGRFEFDLQTSVKELRLRLEAPLHSELERALPPPSDLVISLVSRRRTLLQRLVEWARRAGKPWDVSPEPTPGHVARVATAQQRRDEIAAWAQNVERKAFGPDPVDARAEREVKALEPGRQALR
jgi:hypothetical protein